MALWEKVRAEFVDVIEWTDDSADTLVWRFERFQNEIKLGAQLTVWEAQLAYFVLVVNAKRDGKPSLQRHLFLTSLRTTRTALLKLVRDRWCIESWHSIRDTQLHGMTTARAAPVLPCWPRCAPWP